MKKRQQVPLRRPKRPKRGDVGVVTKYYHDLEAYVSDVSGILRDLEHQHDAAETRIAELEAALRDLIWVIAGEQEDPIELARALGPEAPVAIARARKALETR